MAEEKTRGTRHVRLNIAAVAAFLVLSILLMTLDILLVTQTRRLSAEVADLQGIQPGAKLTALSGLGAEGQHILVRFGDDSPDTLVLVFSAECGPCNENWPNWDSLLASIKPRSVRLVAIRLWGALPEDYIARHQLDHMILITDPGGEEVFEDNLRTTPETILTSPNGVVRAAWPGDVTQPKRDQILRLIGQDERARGRGSAKLR
jgi:hypothetical protein